MSEKHALFILEQQILTLNDFCEFLDSKTDPKVSKKMLINICDTAISALQECLPERTARIASNNFSSIKQHVKMEWWEKSNTHELYRYGIALGQLAMAIDTLLVIQGILNTEPKMIFDPSPVPKPDSKKVFLIHGHDRENLNVLIAMLNDRWSLEPIVLSGTPGKGRTLIEKFEEEAQNVAYAIALLTPDDMVADSTSSICEYGQARPNVIFELGWFHGHLGRAHACILFKKGTKIHSDLDGISRIEFQDSVKEVSREIELELEGVGLI